MNTIPRHCHHGDGKNPPRRHHALQTNTAPIPLAANPAQCTRLTFNPSLAATGSANSKVVYYNGTWYMAFNETVNNPNNGWTGADTWRILWATSSDGQNWAIQPTPLFRSTHFGSSAI